MVRWREELQQPEEKSTSLVAVWLRHKLKLYLAA
jgi:hypothetical protein